MEASKPTAASNSGGGGIGRRNRGRGKRGNNKRGNAIAGSGKGSVKKTMVPPPPQVKLAIRNISNPAVFGTAKAILEQLLQPMIEASNNKASSTTATPNSAGQGSAVPNINGPYLLEMDVAAKRYIIDEEEAAAQYLKEEATKHDAAGQKEAIPEEGNADSSAPVDESKAPDAKPDQPPEQSDPEVVVAPVVRPAGVPIVTVRPLYVVPPKKTRRRGDRSGVAYILLTGPKIEKVEVPDAVPEEKQDEQAPEAQKAEGGEQQEGTDKVAVLEEVPTEVASSETNKEVEEAPELVPEAGEAAEAAVPTPAPKQDGPPSPAADYSRAIARGKLLLQRAVKLLTELAEEDSKGPQNYAQLIVETALSGKTWRLQSSRPDRREGTLETTSDYKNWLKGLEKQQEDLKARPKPTPGGGAGGASGEDPNGAGESVAAIVQHLRAKRQEMKRKKSKKKGKDTSKDGKGSKGKGGKAGAGEGGKKKKSKKRPKKKGGTGNPKAVAPTSLLKSDARNKGS